MARQFTDTPAVRERVPLLIGLTGPSGGGKTFSALRLATGIQSVTGGDIYHVDTESKRALHYAEQFKFRHVPFGAPFGSRDYLDVLRFCVGKGARIVIVDSASHEHEGEGGYLEYHENELDRMAGNDFGKRNALTFPAWAKPSAERRALINGLLQLDCHFIFCFRAKEKTKMLKVNGRTELIPQGFMPIAGMEFIYEMQLNCLLLPNAKGKPSWSSEEIGERQMMKLPMQFEYIFDHGDVQLSEDVGMKLAQWAKGDGATAPKAATNGNGTTKSGASDEQKAVGVRIKSLITQLSDVQLSTWRAGILRSYEIDYTKLSDLLPLAVDDLQVIEEDLRRTIDGEPAPAEVVAAAEADGELDDPFAGKDGQPAQEAMAV